MTKTKVTLCPADPTIPSLTVDAYKTDTPGLVIHRAYLTTGEKMRGWTVTHAASGQALSRFCLPSRQVAMQAAAVAGSLPVDWTASRNKALTQFNACSDDDRKQLYQALHRS